MIVKKYEIVRAIDKLKSVVQKNDRFPALAGILVKDGNLIASNTEITIKVKLEASAGESFIIPMKAFDLIKNLPEGDVEITEGKDHVVTIRTDKIKNNYQSFDAGEFAFDKSDMPIAEGVKLPGEEIMKALGHVAFAAADKATNRTMTGIYFEGGDGFLNLVGLDGHVVAWDSIDVQGTSDMKIIVPKGAVKKLLSMGMTDDVTVTYNKNSVVFSSDEYTIYSRLVDGEFFKYNKIFSEGKIAAYIQKKALIDAMTRAKMCTDENSPTSFNIHDSLIDIGIKDKVADYHEVVQLQKEVKEPIRIGFNSKLVLEAIKAFTCEDIVLNFASPVMPMTVEAEDSQMKVLVLPVKLQS